MQDYLAEQKKNPNANLKMTQALEEMIAQRLPAAATTKPATTKLRLLRSR